MKKILILIILAGFFPGLGQIPVLSAQDRRAIPLDLYLIIDDSTAFRQQKGDAFTWVNQYVVDRILMEGDNITVWAAGDRAEIVFSGTVSGASGGKEAIRSSISALQTNGRTADFTGALRDASARVAQTPQTRLAVTKLVTASAANLEPVLTGGAQSLLRWSRSLRYEGWQIIIAAPEIGPRVREAAQAYMNSR